MRAITSTDYATLLDLDKYIYPTDNPVTLELLNTWFSELPQFGIMLENGDELYGMCIAIPLNKKGWDGLISGEIAEADLDESTLFKPGRDSQLGIHIYHIEKLMQTAEPIYVESLRGLQQNISDLHSSGYDFSLAGFSALCVTAQGIGLFSNKLNCRERDYINPEHILRNSQGLKIVELESQGELSMLLKNGCDYVNRCKMLVTYPQEPSLVWEYLK